MVVDIKKHEKKRMAFLGALYEIAQEHIKSDNETNDPIDVLELRKVIGQRAGLTDPDSERFGSELKRQGMLDSPDWNDDLINGPLYSLTQYGLEEIENHLYEKSRLAAGRKAKSWLLDSGKELAKSVWSKALAGFGVLLATWALGYKWDNIISWVRSLFPR